MANDVDISKESNYCSILLQCKLDNDLVEICDFFQYRTANEHDCPLSFKIDSIFTDAQKDELYNMLLDAADIYKEDFLFNSLLRNRIKDIRMLELSDSTLKCDRIKGFFHQNNPSKNGRSQHQIDSVFKHIRNAFAHGRICFNNEYIIMEDKQNELTARLIISLSALRKWKQTIEEYVKERNSKYGTSQRDARNTGADCNSEI